MMVSIEEKNEKMILILGKKKYIVIEVIDLFFSFQTKQQLIYKNIVLCYSIKKIHITSSFKNIAKEETILHNFESRKISIPSNKVRLI